MTTNIPRSYGQWRVELAKRLWVSWRCNRGFIRILHQDEIVALCIMLDPNNRANINPLFDAEITRDCGKEVKDENTA